MIKNLNDLFSLFTLIILLIFSIRLLIWAYIQKDENELVKVNRFQLFKEYIDNEEE